MKRTYFFYLLIGILLLGCAPQRSNPVNAAYHDITAHYNAYFIANEHIKAIEARLHDQYEWNYDKILPIYAPYDSTDAVALKDQLTDCIEKASICIQRHPEAKWEYPAYVLVGKARMYGMEFPDAVEAFKYVNTKSDNDDVRHEALINLMRTFTINKEYKNAAAVIDYLKKEELSNKNKEAYYLSQAHFYQQTANLDLMTQNLVKAEELLINAKDKARIQFIIGQLYQRLGFSASAFYYYEKSLRNNPSYELSFYTKLNMAQVTELSEGKDVKTIRKYFKKLLVDRKNFEYNDKIYYEMGVFAEKNNNLKEAIGHYKKSVRVSQGNNRQKGLSYLSLAKIYYDSLKNFEVAKNYYDSTVNTLPKDEENYLAIKERQEILIDFVKHITTIRLNDSLLTLSKLPPDSLKSWANNLIVQDSIQQLERKKEAQKLARVQQQRESRASDDEGILISTGSDGAWYFDNPKSVSTGFTNFQRKWKQRPLEDHWRRSVKIISNQEVASNEESEIAPEKNIRGNSSNEESAESVETKISAILTQIPTTPEQKEKLEFEIRDALYAVGNIYNFRLLETENAISTFEELLRRFPGSPQEPEVLYQLFLLYQGDKEQEAKRVAGRLSSEYPESIYAKLIANPNYREETFAITQRLQSVYRLAYDLYDQKQFAKSQLLLDSALSSHPNNEFSDNLQLLRILNIGHLEGQHQYQFELDNFVKTYSESELIPYAETLMETSNEYKVNLYSSSKAKYSGDLNQAHVMVLAYANSDENGTIAKRLIEAFISKNNLTEPYANLLLSEEYSIIVMKNLTNKNEAQKRSNTLAGQYNLFDQFKGQKHSLFVMTEENFDIFYKTKDIETYKSFFDKYYQ